MKSPAFEDIAALWRVRRSGLFSSRAYRRANPDIGSYPAALHYIRHGEEFGRKHGQSPISRWLLPYVADGRLGKTELDILKRDLVSDRAKEVMASVGIRPEDLKTLDAQARLDAKTLAEVARHASPGTQIDAAYLLADRFNDLSLADLAVESGMSALSTLRRNELRHLCDLVIASGRVEHLPHASRAMLASSSAKVRHVSDCRQPSRTSASARCTDMPGLT